MYTLITNSEQTHTLAMLGFDFKIRYKKASEMPADFLSRSFQQTCAISILGKDWVSLQEKDTQCKLIREALDNNSHLVQKGGRTGKRSNHQEQYLVDQKE